MALTAKQQRFVDEYLIDLNATQAAIRAGCCTWSGSVSMARSSLPMVARCATRAVERPEYRAYR